MMIGFDKTITIYNRWFDKDTKKDVWTRTIINEVSWSGCQRVTTGDGLTSNDGYSIRIPVDSMPNGFLERDEYVTLYNPNEHWTAQNGDVVVLGSVEAEVINSITEITKQFTNSFTVIAVHTDNMTRILPHLRIEGK